MVREGPTQSQGQMVEVGPARKVRRTLKSLGLPTVNDVREEFEKLAADLDVK